MLLSSVMSYGMFSSFRFEIHCPLSGTRMSPPPLPYFPPLLNCNCCILLVIMRFVSLVSRLFLNPDSIHGMMLLNIDWCGHRVTTTRRGSRIAGILIFNHSWIIRRFGGELSCMTLYKSGHFRGRHWSFCWSLGSLSRKANCSKVWAEKVIQNGEECTVRRKRGHCRIKSMKQNLWCMIKYKIANYAV